MPRALIFGAQRRSAMVVEADHDWGAGRHEGLYQHNKQLHTATRDDHAARLRIR